MRKPFSLCLLLACAIALVLLSAAPAVAFSGTAESVGSLGIVADTITLSRDEWHGYTFDMGSGGQLVYGIQSPPDNIDVYIVNAAGLASYRNQQSFTSLRSIENSDQIAGTFTTGTGSVTVIIDNTNESATGAMTTGPVTVQVGMTFTGSGGSNPFAIDFGLIVTILVIIIVLVVVLLVVGIVLSQRKKKNAPPPQQQYQQQQYQQPYPPYQQPPQGGTPPQGPVPPGP